MSVPKPSANLEGHCAVVRDGTLYFLSGDAFQSLELKKHARWRKEKSGVPVKGAACVQAGNDDLYVIGGTTTDDNYSGLQRYSFSSKSWETLPLVVDVMQGRTEHSAAYLQDSNSIFVYAGSQPEAPSYLSSQTFLISLEKGNNIQAFTSMGAPTANLPILLPFNSSHAVMAGGSPLSNEIWLFSTAGGFERFPVDTAGPLDGASRGTIIDGSDGSKVLQIYDFSASPNNVTQIVLLGEDGQPGYTGQPVGSQQRRKRDLTLQDWPEYDDSNAPTQTRSDCGVAQSADNVAIVAGGSEEMPLAMFDQDENSWVDADKFFSSRQQPLQASQSSRVSASTPTATSSASASATDTANPIAGDGKAHDRMLRTLGITLGVLCGIAAVFIIVLLYLRWRKMQQRKREGYLDEKNGEARMSFQDRGASFMKEAGGSINEISPPPPKPWYGQSNDSQDGSRSSLAIIAGKFGNKRNTNGHAPKQSYDSTTPLRRGKSSRSQPERVEMVDIEKRPPPVERKPLPRTAGTADATVGATGASLLGADLANQEVSDRRNRSSGWSKYFATSHPTGSDGLGHLPSAYLKPDAQSDGSFYSTDRHISQPSRIPSSALVPPLDIDFSKTIDGQRLSHVTSGSPAFNDSREDLARRGSVGNLGVPEGQKGLIVDPGRPRSQSESLASSYNRSTMSSNLTSDFFADSGATPWTPTSTSFKDHLISRPPSSNYTNSIYEQRVPSRGKSAGFFPGPGTSYRPSRTKMSHNAAPSSEWASPQAKPAALALHRPAEDRESTMTVFPKGTPSAYYGDPQPQARPGAAAPSTLAPQRPPEARESTMTLFPKGVNSTYYAERQPLSGPTKPVNSDLGWLNLGLNNGSQTRL